MGINLSLKNADVAGDLSAFLLLNDSKIFGGDNNQFSRPNQNFIYLIYFYFYLLLFTRKSIRCGHGFLFAWLSYQSLITTFIVLVILLICNDDK